jgi:uncharacterized membrane protein YdjX (TVP38/TMEM64 family)
MAIFPKSGPWRIALLITALVAVLSVPYMIWGERVEASWEGANVLEFIRAQGAWAAVVGVGLIVADLFVPIPTPAIMAALGLIYGFLPGGLISVFGSFMAGMVGYGLCRAIGPRAALWITGPKDMEKLSGFFERCGMWGIAVSRLMPWIPEILACLAGLSRMKLAPFAMGNLIGSVGVGFLNAYFGSRGETDPETLAVVLILPYVMIPIFLFVLAKGYFSKTPAKTDTPPYETS